MSLGGNNFAISVTPKGYAVSPAEADEGENDDDEL